MMMIPEEEELEPEELPEPEEEPEEDSEEEGGGVVPSLVHWAVAVTRYWSL